MPVEDYFAVSCLSEGVPSALVAARDSIDALLRDRGLRRTTPELTTESLLRGAAALGDRTGCGAHFVCIGRPLRVMCRCG